MLVSEIVQRIEQILPLSLAVKDDPVGVQVLADDRSTGSVAVAYEVDDGVLEEAAGYGTGLIVAFHPLIYAPLKSVRGDSGRVGRMVVGLIRQKIALWIAHTAFDAHPDGTSALFARELGLQNTAPLVPSPIHSDAGMGIVGDLPDPLELPQLAELVRRVSKSPSVRVSGYSGGRMDAGIRRVAILGGSGMSFYRDAVAAGAQAFITADIRYHDFHGANDAIPVIDPGHAESERFVVEGLTALVQTALSDTGITVHAIRRDTNPVQYVQQ